MYPYHKSVSLPLRCPPQDGVRKGNMGPTTFFATPFVDRTLWTRDEATKSCGREWLHV